MAGSLYVDNIGGGTPDASAAAQTDSVTGGLLPPRMTTVQRNAIATPATSLLVYDTDLSALYIYIGGWVVVSSSGGGAPANATYITQTPNSGLSNEQALSTLATGLMQVTTTTGVVSSVTTSVGLAALISDETGSGALVFGTSPSLTTPVISGGTIDNATVGATTPSTGAFTTLAATNTSTASFFALTGDGVGVNNRNDAYLNTAGTAPTLQTRRARGSLASPSDVQASDRLGQWTAAGYASGAFAVGFALIVSVPSGATIAANSVPSYATFEAIRANGDTSRAEYLGLRGTELVLNEDSADIDFRVESDGSTSALFVDGGNNRVAFFTSAPSYDVSIGGNAARTLSMERHTTSNTAGNNLTVSSGGATSGATNKAAGALILTTGINTGNAIPASIRLQAGVMNPTSGTGDNANVDRWMTSSKVLTNNSAITILNATAATLLGIGGIIRYSIEVTNGTDIQMETGFAVFSGVNKGGAFTVSITEVNSQQSVSAGTLTTTWAISSANPAAISINANSSLTPSTGYPRITYSVENFSQQAIAAA